VLTVHDKKAWESVQAATLQTARCCSHNSPHGLEGLPTVHNGIGLCELHHAAFDDLLLGITLSIQLTSGQTFLMRLMAGAATRAEGTTQRKNHPPTRQKTGGIDIRRFGCMHGCSSALPPESNPMPSSSRRFRFQGVTHGGWGNGLPTMRNIPVC
jgi:hypothetical protein